MTYLLHGFPASANTHRVRAFLSILKQPFEEHIVDLVTGQQRAPEFLAISPAGQVPVLVDGATRVFDSHAILIHLAQKHDDDGRWWPHSAADRVQVLAWMFFDANELHNGIGWARNHLAFGVPGDPAPYQQRGRRALQALQARLATLLWLAGERPSLADLSCAPLVAVSHEAGLPLEPYPAVGEWLGRVHQIPGFPSMPRYR